MDVNTLVTFLTLLEVAAGTHPNATNYAKLNPLLEQTCTFYAGRAQIRIGIDGKAYEWIDPSSCASHEDVQRMESIDNFKNRAKKKYYKYNKPRR